MITRDYRLADRMEGAKCVVRMLRSVYRPAIEPMRSKTRTESRVSSNSKHGDLRDEALWGGGQSRCFCLCLIAKRTTLSQGPRRKRKRRMIRSDRTRRTQGVLGRERRLCDAI